MDTFARPFRSFPAQGLAPAAQDNTRVVSRLRSTPSPDAAEPRPSTTRLANLELRNAWSDISHPAPMPADNTRVVRKPKAEQAPPQPPQLYFRQGNPGDIERARQQEATNRICEIDPVAAEINGMRNLSLNPRQPDWQKVSGSPLEYVTAARFPLTFGAVGSIRGMKEAVHEPTALNIGTAVVGTGSLLLSGIGRFGVLPHTLERGAEAVHLGMNGLEAGGSLDRIKASLHHEGAEKPE